MARKKGSKNKKKAVETPKAVEIEQEKLEIQDKKEPEVEKVVIVEPEIVVKDDSGLEDKPYFSLDETARHLKVPAPAASLWFNHGHLKGIDDRGLQQVSRASIIEFKKGKLYKMVSEVMG